MTVSYAVMPYKSATLLNNDTFVRAPLLILDKDPSETGMMKDIRTKCVLCNMSLICLVVLPELMTVFPLWMFDLTADWGTLGAGKEEEKTSDDVVVVGILLPYRR